MQDPFESPNGDVQETKAKKRRSKPTNISNSGFLTPEQRLEQTQNLIKTQKDFIQEASKLKKSFFTLRDDLEITTLSSEAQQDPLIKQQLALFHTLESEIDLMLNKRTALVKEYKLMSVFIKDVNSKKLNQDMRAKQEFIKLFNFFIKDKIPVDSNITDKHVEMLLKVYATVGNKHGMISAERRTQTLIQNDGQELPLLKEKLGDLAQIKNLIIARRAELEGKGGINQLKSKLADLLEEIRLTKALIRHTYTISATLAGSALSSEQQDIFKEMEKILSARKLESVPLTGSDAYLTIPLEADRLAANILSAQKAHTGLTRLKSRLVENQASIAAAITEAAKKVQSNLTTRAQHQLAKIEQIQQIQFYKRRFGDKLEQAKLDIDSFLKTVIVPSKEESLHLISQREDKGLNTLNNIVSEIHVELERANLDVFKSRLYQAEHDLRELEEAKNGCLANIAIFNPDFATIRQHLAHHQIADPNVFIADRQYIAGLLSMEKVIANLNASAIQLFERIYIRQQSREVRIVSTMINAIIEELRALEASDPRITLLETLQRNLNDNLNHYLQFKIGKTKFVDNAINIIHDQCNKDKLSHLSDDVSNGFIKFLRSLLEPLNKLVQTIKGTTYETKFFANHTEHKVARAAEKTHAALSTIKLMLANDEEPQAEPPKLQ